MQHSHLLKECSLIYRSVKLQIQQGALQLTDELRFIEWAFSLSLRAWTSIENIINQHQFLDQQDEIDFYKILKPQFIGLVDHFPLLYKSVLFKPEEITAENAYRENELANCNQLIYRLKSSCQSYLKQPETDLHFLKHHNQQPFDFGLDVSQVNITTASYSCLLGKLVALKKFKQYLLAQQHRCNFPFGRNCIKYVI
jgi:hypothetical protein